MRPYPDARGCCFKNLGQGRRRRSNIFNARVTPPPNSENLLLVFRMGLAINGKDGSCCRRQWLRRWSYLCSWPIVIVAFRTGKTEQTSVWKLDLILFSMYSLCTYKIRGRGVLEKNFRSRKKSCLSQSHFLLSSPCNCLNAVLLPCKCAIDMFIRLRHIHVEFVQQVLPRRAVGDPWLKKSFLDRFFRLLSSPLPRLMSWLMLFLERGAGAFSRTIIPISAAAEEEIVVKPLFV